MSGCECLGDEPSPNRSSAQDALRGRPLVAAFLPCSQLPKIFFLASANSESDNSPRE